MIKQILVGLGISLIVILFIPILIFIINFHDHFISANSSDWGTFGDYIGGIANPIIGIVNVLVLVYLTLKISEIDSNNKRQDTIKRENENLDRIRLEGFKELNSFFMKTVKRLANDDPIKHHEKVSLKFEFDGIIHPYIDLFKTFDDLERINTLSNRFLKMPEYRTESENMDIMTNLSKLISEIRIEIRTITINHNEKI